MEECEVKFLYVDPEKLESQILTLGGQKKYDRVFRRSVLDFPDLRLNSDNAWLRLRDEGDRIVLTFKQRLGATAHDGSSNDDSMLEEEVVVNDFQTTASILHRLGMTEKFYEENRRVHFTLDGVSLDIDHWPMIPPYLEIEAPTWVEVDAMITKLGFDPGQKKIYSTQQIYQSYGITEDDYQIITFAKQVKKGQT